MTARAAARHGADARGQLGPEVKRRIMIGTYALSAGYYDAYYNQAQRVRTLIAATRRAYGSVDVLVSPATPSTAFPLREEATIRWRCTCSISARCR